MYTEPSSNQYLLDMIENIGNVATTIKPAPIILKKDLKFLQFQIFSIKNQYSEFFPKKLKRTYKININNNCENNYVFLFKYIEGKYKKQTALIQTQHIV